MFSLGSPGPEILALRNLANSKRGANITLQEIITAISKIRDDKGAPLSGDDGKNNQRRIGILNGSHAVTDKSNKTDKVMRDIASEFKSPSASLKIV